MQQNGILLLDPTKKMSARYIFGEVATSQPILKAFNQALGYGVFGCVNQATSTGRDEANITHLCSFYADFDNGIPDWSKCALSPSSIVESSPGKQQAYWHLTSPLSYTQEAAATYLAIEHALVTKLGGDQNARDIPRVLRIPGYVNTKYATRPMVKELLTTDFRYTMDEMNREFGMIEQPKMSLGAARTALADESRAIDKLHKAIRNNPPPAELHTWNKWLYCTATFAIGNLGLSAATIEDELITHLNGFEPEEISRTVRNADKYAKRMKPVSVEVEI
jgi:hypothetical protein